MSTTPTMKSFVATILTAAISRVAAYQNCAVGNYDVVPNILYSAAATSPNTLCKADGSYKSQGPMRVVNMGVPQAICDNNCKSDAQCIGYVAEFSSVPGLPYFDGICFFYSGSALPGPATSCNSPSEYIIARNKDFTVNSCLRDPAQDTSGPFFCSSYLGKAPPQTVFDYTSTSTPTVTTTQTTSTKTITRCTLNTKRAAVFGNDGDFDQRGTYIAHNPRVQARDDPTMPAPTCLNTVDLPADVITRGCNCIEDLQITSQTVSTALPSTVIKNVVATTSVLKEKVPVYSLVARVAPKLGDSTASYKLISRVLGNTSPVTRVLQYKKTNPQDPDQAVLVTIINGGLYVLSQYNNPQLYGLLLTPSGGRSGGVSVLGQRPVSSTTGSALSNCAIDSTTRQLTCTTNTGAPAVLTEINWPTKGNVGRFMVGVNAGTGSVVKMFAQDAGTVALGCPS